jgi:hypothetical protein
MCEDVEQNEQNDNNCQHCNAANEIANGPVSSSIVFQRSGCFCVGFRFHESG